MAYVLEPPRVGGSNSPFTLTPNDVISDAAAFAAAYPSNESAPRTEYMIQVLRESGPAAVTGPGGRAVLPDATFAWTRNEGAIQGGLSVPFQRFDYAGQDQVFKPLQGAPRQLVGTLAADANTARLTVAAAPLLTNLAAFPIRVSVGATGSGVTFPVTVVGAFGSPSSGNVEMNAAGQLHWNAANVTANLGAPVHFQRQTFYFPNETTGMIGTLGIDPVLLNPLPATGQMPAVKIGSRNHLTAVQRATEAAFSADPGAGTVEWALTTGRLKFNSALVVALSGQPVIYDGVFLATFQVPAVPVGLAQAMPCGTIAVMPSEASGTYFRIAGVTQFEKISFVDAFDATGKRGTVQIRRSDRAVQLSAADRAEHSGRTVDVVLPDVLIERGVSLRLFRSPVNPAGTTAGVKDVTAFYTQEGATLASPIIGQPFVFLPALPQEDVALTVQVSQGTGSFVGELSRLDVAAPPTGKGYVLDFQTRQLSYAERKAAVILPTPLSAFSTVQLPNAPVLSAGLTVELEDEVASGNFVQQVENEDFVIDLGSGVITYTQTDGEILLAGVATLAATTLTVGGNLSTAGVQEGDILVISSEPSEGVYTIDAVLTSSTASVIPAFPSAATNVAYEIRRGKEVLADRFFRDVPPVDPNTSIERIKPLGVIANAPRLAVNPLLSSRVRLRFGKTTFSTTTSVVSVFAAPGSLAAGVVEVHEETGELNFSAADVAAGGTVYWSSRLLLGTEYNLQPTLGFIEFADRMLQGEETYLRYTILSDDGVTKIPVEERGSFLVPKELVQPHPVVTSTLSFNPAGREVAQSPAPRAFRGGRPQSSQQVVFDVVNSTVTFLDDGVITDALPHGSGVDPFENVYVDYYIHEAIGGESNLTVQQVPMATVQVIFASEDESGEAQTSFVIDGDRTLDFQANGLLEVDGADHYLISGSTFDGTQTLVTLDQTVPQFIRSDSRNPPLRVSSGALRRLGVGSYFTLEDAPYDAIARGSKKIRLLGDRTRAYFSGTIILLTDSLAFQEFNRVEGASYDASTERTTLVLASAVVRQHTPPTVLLRSVRPILASPAGTVTTVNSPVLSLPFAVYRQVEGQVGQVLVRDRDYTLDESGAVTFTDGLTLQEEIGIFYTGVSVLDAELRTRASWTFAIVPTVDNGLANQVLTMDYTTYIPDTFFYRVETPTNYRAELLEEFGEEAKATSPSQGPILENSGGKPLHEKGNPSLFFEEGDLANQDVVARATLLSLNEIISGMEVFMAGLNGHVVGDHDGPFLFDGEVDNPVRTQFVDATNQIDDLMQVFGSTPRRAFEAANYSRFYPTQRLEYGAAASPVGLATGDPILNLRETALKAVMSVRKRSPWAVTTQAVGSGSSVFQVDHARGDAELLRPGLNVAASLKVAITARDGTVLVADATPATVASTTLTSVTLTAPVGIAVPKGSTIRMASTDDVHRQTYSLGVDVGVDVSGGFLTHVSNDDVPEIFVPNSSPAAGVLLDVVLQCGLSSTDPARFPALDGGTADDDGNRQFPALAISAGGELATVVAELALINAATGTLADIVTASFVGSGNVTASTTLDRGSAWLVPIPKIGDLVRLLTGGTEGTSYYHRISAVGASTVTVQPAFSISSGAVTFEITTGPTLVSRTAALSSTTVLTDAGGNFIASGVQRGHTVVGVSGTFIGQRRQVASVDSATQITVTSPFTTTGPIVYEIVDSLATYGGAAGSLQESWVSTLTEELRALEGQDLIDFADIIVEEVATQTLTVSTINMGAFDHLLVFVAIDCVSSGTPTVASATFNGAALPIKSTVSSGLFGLHTYLGSGLTGVTGNLVITATDTSPNTKVFALKLSRLETTTFGATTLGTALATTAPATLGATGLSSVEAGDLIVSFAFTALETNEIYPLSGHDTLVPQFSGSGIGALLTVTRAAAGRQSVAPQFRVVGTATTTRVVTVVLTKDSGADPIAGRPVSERAVLERVLLNAVPDRGVGALVGNITNATTITGDFTSVATGDVVFVPHGPNRGAYEIATATASSATIVAAFPSVPETNLPFKAGRLALVTLEVLQDALAVLGNVETAIVGAGSLLLQHHCPIPVYRNATVSGGLPGTLDSSFTKTSGRLVKAGAYARPVASLASREAALNLRAATSDQADLESVLASAQLYDKRFVWIDSRINLETGILPKKDRAVESRRKALEKVIKNLTKILSM